MPADHEPEGSTFERRREKWAQEAADLRAAGSFDDSSPEATVRRYERSRTASVALRAPTLSPQRYHALSRRHRALGRRRALLMLLVPVVIVAGVMIDPLVAKVVVWALLVPLVALVLHHTREIARIEQQRHLVLRGGLADAWHDWLAAREELEAVDAAAQARAALGVNEPRMESLVVALAQADAAGLRDTPEHAESRAWVHATAAKAVALAAAERKLGTVLEGRSAVAELQVAPDGDTDALDQALAAARELGRDDQHP